MLKISKKLIVIIIVCLVAFITYTAVGFLVSSNKMDQKVAAVNHVSSGKPLDANQEKVQLLLERKKALAKKNADRKKTVSSPVKTPAVSSNPKKSVTAIKTAKVVPKRASVKPAVSSKPVPKKLLVEQLRGIGGAQQVIIVTSSSWKNQRATFQTFEKVNGVWRQKFSPITCCVGRNGISTNRHEGDKTTPAGRYTMGYAFGWGGNPGTSLSYRSSGADDYWVSGKTLNLYNVWVHRVGGPDPTWGGKDSYEKLNHPLYKYASIINFNMGSSKVIGKGSGIFFHCATSSMAPTAGCVAVPQRNVIQVLRWLNPDKNPIIIIGQKDWLLKNM